MFRRLRKALFGEGRRSSEFNSESTPDESPRATLRPSEEGARWGLVRSALFGECSRK